MRHLSSSEKQWITSFLLFDALFWVFVIRGCAISSVVCLETASFGSALFYLPFWLLSPDFGSIGGYATGLVTGPLIGLLCHAFLGFGIGYYLRKKSVRWSVSIPVAFAILFVVFVVSVKSAIITGMFL